MGKMKKGMWALLLALALCLGAVCALAGDYGVAVVQNDKEPYTANLRKGKGTSTKTLGAYFSGTQATLLDTSDEEWWKVDVYGRVGYMQRRFLVECGFQSDLDEDVIKSARDARPTYVVDNPNPMDRLNLREQPSEDGASKGKFYNGTEALVLGTVGSFCHVQVEDTEEGYPLTGFMQKKYLSPQGARVAPPQKRPEAEAAEDAVLGYAIVNNPKVSQKLYLRDAPSPSGEALAQFENGVTVELLAHEKGWYEVHAWDRLGDYIGFMKDEYLLRDAQTPDFTPVEEGIVIGPEDRKQLPIYQQPTQDGEIRYVPYTKGETRVEILCRAGTFYRVRAGEEEGFTRTLWVLPVGDGSGDYGDVCNPEPKDRLNLRVSPEEGTKIALKLFNGTQVEILEEQRAASGKAWLRVRVNTEDGFKEGWVMKDFIRRIE